MNAKVKKLRVLLIDDERNLIHDRVARDYFDGVKALTEEGPWDILLLDHDLSCYDENGNEKTGYDVVLFLEKNPRLRPDHVKLVTASLSGAQRMARGLLAMGYDGWGIYARDFYKKGPS